MEARIQNDEISLNFITSCRINIFPVSVGVTFYHNKSFLCTDYPSGSQYNILYKMCGL